MQTVAIQTVDLRGTPCPTNFVKAKLKLEELEPGDIIEFLIDDGEPVRNLPRSLKAEGHRLLGLKESGSSYILTLEKGND